ncbi:hypothetical protein L226DRAFT_521898 [Lentinus tigrinus ALCF2SS1-7]|uniref:uncharacterized protein n=1 Tax=Lentinus tigrinus ALCF2SS1-7 TaxID=1328758 RepID=UPI001165E1CA|nr:hypothetical protein L226DRAFT_521898 [Lentinus tigrinus ALCF2SS1-7]
MQDSEDDFKMRSGEKAVMAGRMRTTRRGKRLCGTQKDVAVGDRPDVRGDEEDDEDDTGGELGPRWLDIAKDQDGRRDVNSHIKEQRRFGQVDDSVVCQEVHYSRAVNENEMLWEHLVKHLLVAEELEDPGETKERD